MFDLTDFLIERTQLLRQPSPLIYLFDVTVPDDGSHLRYCDFWDPDARGSGPRKVPFDGEEYEAMAMTIGDIHVDQDGSGGLSFPVAILDPLHQVAFFLITHGWLEGARVKMWLTAWDVLGDPSKASSLDLVVTRASLTEGPDTATIMLGSWGIYEEKRPHFFYDRGKCWNPYQNRFTPGNGCTYPSDEFSAQTKQDLLIGGEYVEKRRKHGWWTQQALRSTVFSVPRNPAAGESPSPWLGKLRIAAEADELGWLNNRRYGPAIAKHLDGDWDVHTLATVPATSRLQWMAGIFAQDLTEAAPQVDEGEPPPEVPASSWVFFGLQANGAGGSRLLLRVTDQDADPVETIVATSDTRLRLVRQGNDFDAYSRATDADPWTLRGEATLTLPAMARIGLLLGSDHRSEEPVAVDFDYFRFLAGGLGPCRKTWEECGIRDNRNQFNGWREIPNDRIRV